jgi:hypothetical protein
MRASHLAVMVTVLALPSAAYSQDSSQVDGRVGPDLNISPMQTSSSLGSIGPYHRPLGPGPPAGYSSAVLPGQVVPGNVFIYTRPDGSGSAFVDGTP